jgi:hypothetical protein
VRDRERERGRERGWGERGAMISYNDVPLNNIFDIKLLK